MLPQDPDGKTVTPNPQSGIADAKHPANRAGHDGWHDQEKAQNGNPKQQHDHTASLADCAAFATTPAQEPRPMALSAYDPVAQAFAPSLALPVAPGSLTSDDLNRALTDAVSRAVTQALAQIVAEGGTTMPATGSAFDGTVPTFDGQPITFDTTTTTAATTTTTAANALVPGSTITFDGQAITFGA